MVAYLIASILILKTASFRGLKVRKKIIREKSKIHKNQKITLKVLSHENRLKNALFTANNVILRFFFCARPKFFKTS
jgi:hypothetical protein